MDGGLGVLVASLVTKSFVFMGEGPNSSVGVAPGGGGKMFRAFGKKTVRIAWKMEPGGTSGAPMTYMVNGTE